MSIPLSSAIARIYDVESRVVGAGFLFSNTHIFTCAHVVAQALHIPEETASAPTQNVILDFPLVASGQKMNAKVVCWRPVEPLSNAASKDDEDIAVLEIESANGHTPGYKPIRLVVTDDVWNHGFRALGFPAQHDGGTWTDGRLMDRQANNWIQIQGKDSFGYFVAPGYSGTAVWDEHLQAVVGMVVVSDKKTETRAAFVIPTRTLIKIWPPLANSVNELRVPEEKPEYQPRQIDAGRFWTDFDPAYHAFHHAHRNSTSYRPDILLITVSTGRVNTMWSEFPEEVLSKAGIDVDVLSVHYPAVKLTSKVVNDLAGKLRLLLSATFGGYQHLLFVTKDADVIVKQMLMEGVGDMLLASSKSRLPHELRVISRTRNLISISTSSSRESNQLARQIDEAFKKQLIDSDIIGFPTPDTVRLSSAIFQNGKDSPDTGSGLGWRAPRPLVAGVAQRLARYKFGPPAALARLTIFRSFAVDPQVRMLFGSPEAIQQDASTTELGGSQKELLDQLTDLAVSANHDSLRIVTGGAGTGKSVLLRRLARRLAILWLRGTPATALPIYVPLSQFKLDASDPRPERLWQSLSRELVSWGNDLLLSNATEEERNRFELIALDEEWLNDQLRRFPTTLILDGVDELLLNNPSLSLTDFASLLRFLRTDFNNVNFLIIASIRSSARDTSLIADSESEVLTLRGMTFSEASEIFPSAIRLIEESPDEAVQRLLFTPLVLSVLDKSKLKLKPEAYLNRAALISAALTADIESLKRGWNGRPYSTNDWLNALSLLAWLQFRELKGEISDRYVATAAAAAIASWSAGPDTDGTTDLINSFRILLDPQSRPAVLRKTVFVPVRESSYRLRHKEWGDYLVSHYAVLCIRFGHFDDLAARALNFDIYIMGGQQFEETETERQTVHALVERASTDNRFLIVGNFAQMLGAAFAPITADVLEDEILAKLDVFPTVVKFAMLSTLSSRILAHDERDAWHQWLTPVIKKSLNEHLLSQNQNALVRSLCWCFLKAMDSTKTGWPGLWNNADQDLQVLSVFATQTASGFVVDDRQRSIQAAFMRIQSYALEIPSRVIGTVHYLYPLVLAFNRRIPLDRSVVGELPLLLADPKVDAVYRNYPVPEIAAIWSRCRALYHEALSRSPDEGDS